MVKYIIILLSLLIPSVSLSAEYKVAFLPDIHACKETATCDYTAIDAITKYVVDNHTSENIEAVFTAGDWCGDDPDDYATCMNRVWIGAGDNTNGFQGIDNEGLPWLSSIGNKDYNSQSPLSNRIATDFTAQVGNTRHVNNSDAYHKKMSDYADSACNSTLAGINGEAANTYIEVTLGGDQWMIFALEFFLRKETAACANIIMTANPTKNIGIVTHGMMKYDGTFGVDGELLSTSTYGLDHTGTPPNNFDGEDIWDEIGKLHKNIVFIQCGHWWGGDETTSLNWLKQTGDKGNTVTIFGGTYQNIYSTPPRGAGWFWIVTFTTGPKKSVYITTYKATAPTGADTIYRPAQYMREAHKAVVNAGGGTTITVGGSNAVSVTD